jgi:sugar/nucleoside kinase (ribokinase family)
MQRQTGSVTPTPIQIAVIGDANVELVLPQLEGMPSFGEEVLVPMMTLRPAGSAANFALCTASLGVNTGFAGRLAVDRFGESVLRAFRETGVNTQWLRLAENEATGLSLVLVREDGERAFITYQGTNANVKLDDVQAILEAKPPPRWLHLAGYHLLERLRGKDAIRLLDQAQENGITTSLDTGWDPLGWKSETLSDVKSLLEFVDVFFPNAAEVTAITGEKSAHRGAQSLIKKGATSVVVKLGAKGSQLVTQKDTRKIPAFEVPVIDTTAAGDAFNAGFAVSMLQGSSLVHATIFATAVAALRVSRKPSQSLFPNLQETTAFLMRHRPLDT